MCGLVGFYTLRRDAANSTYAADRQRFITQGLVIDTLRGMDATGIFFQNGGHMKTPAAVLKDNVTGAEFIDSYAWKKMAEQMHQATFVVGHNRASTIGSSTKENAHPFKTKGVVLVHNGTCRNVDALPLGKNLPKGVKVDSHAIAHNFAAVEPAKVGQVVEKITGGSALIWHDARDKSLNFLRNTQRPLHFALAQQGETLLWASEAGQLQFLCERIKMGVTKMYSLDDGYHLKFVEGEGLKPRVKRLSFSHGGTYPSGSRGKQQATGGGAASAKNSTSSAQRTAGTAAPSRTGVRGGTHKPHDAGQRNASINNAYASVPEVLVDSLLRWRLTPGDRFHMFCTKELGGVRGSAVEGYARTLGMKVRLIAPQSALSLKGTSDLPWLDESFYWIAQPLAVMMENNLPVIICAYKGVTYKAGSEHFEYGRKAGQLVAGKGASRNLPGPEGKMIQPSKWMKYTRHGCGECGARLDISAAWRTTFYQDGKAWKPRCFCCTAVHEGEVTKEQVEKGGSGRG